MAEQTDAWQEVRTTGEGLSVTTYRGETDGPAHVTEESYWTWGELVAMAQENSDLEISINNE